jgi:hypothetical protein
MRVRVRQAFVKSRGVTQEQEGALRPYAPALPEILQRIPLPKTTNREGE